MDYMFQPGFLGTKAPLFMDVVTLIVALLPFLIYIGIMFAKGRNFSVHAKVQQLLFWVSVIVVGYFEYGVRSYGGFEAFMESSNSSYSYAFWVLIFHIIIAVVTLGIWINTLIRARKDFRVNALPGMYTKHHKNAGIRTFIGIILTSVTGLWVYYILFMH
ncbi:MAG TPA: DUF420 domain-containing protein [Epsilonproteobacteria bacterium]|nr:DUF420 domain-containing protein [Campylobacterota bacterium]